MKIWLEFLTGVHIKPKVLFVDDNISFIKSAVTFLKSDENFEFAGNVSSGEEAIEKIKKEKPDLILMDIKMSGMDGFEATKAIKEINPAIKIIILSLHEEKQYIDNALAAGADGFIKKSDFVNDFYPLINDILVIKEI